MSLHTISDTIERALRSAGLDPTSGTARGVSETIRKALASAGLTQQAPPAGGRPAAGPSAASTTTDDPIPVVERLDAGHFLARTHAGPVGSRPYKFYVPAGADDTPRPLVVMLHGCKQNPDDFAAGTRMNLLAERHGFLVAYPAQARHANGSNCWNWFRPEDQRRDGGEPEILAGIVADVARDHRVDPARVFVAGLSAGAAMAVILGQTHPEIFAAVGAHSGLPVGAAHDVGSAFMAMSGGQGGHAPAPSRRGAATVASPRTIVFHGDQDATVAARNGEAIVAQAVAGGAPLTPSPRERGFAQGRDYTRTVYTDAAGGARVESWWLHGGAHAWSGGSAQGSYTDPSGPDASAEMVRFFLNTH